MNNLEGSVWLYAERMDYESIVRVIERDSIFSDSLKRINIGSLESNLFVQWYYWKVMHRLSGKYSFRFVNDDDDSRWQRDSDVKEKTVLVMKLNKAAKKNLRQIGIDAKANSSFLILYIDDELGDNELDNLLVETFLSANSLHLLLNGNVKKYPSYVWKVMRFKRKIESAGFKTEDFVVVSSGILGMYGMREPTDIDMVTLEPNYQKICNKIIDCHHHVLHTYEISAEELVCIPLNYVYWNGVKFATLDVVYRACCNRKEETKKIDGYFIDILRGNLSIDFFSLTRMRARHYLLRTMRECRKKCGAIINLSSYVKIYFLAIKKNPDKVFSKICGILRRKNENN